MIKFGYDVMRPIYPLLIQQFLDDYGLSEGVAVDIGAGPGNMALELAKVTAMELILIDIEGSALTEAKANFDRLEADNSVSYLCADVANLPLKDNFADFIMSRGSVGLWPKPAEGLAEVYRILKPGGVAIVGVGAGRYLPDTMRDRIYNAMRESVAKRDPITVPVRYSSEKFESIMIETGIKNYRIIPEPSEFIGCWVEFRK